MAHEVQDVFVGEETEPCVTEVLPGKFNDNVGGDRTDELSVGWGRSIGLVTMRPKATSLRPRLTCSIIGKPTSSC